MSLRWQTLLNVALTLLVLTAVLYLASSTLLLRGVESLELVEMEKELLRARKAVVMNLRAMQLTVEDWAHWDDTYEFMVHRQSAYRSNLMPESLVTLDIDYLLLFDLDGNLVAGGGLTEEIEIQAPSSKFLEQIWAAFAENGLVEKGIIESGEYPLLVSAARILTNEGKGPSRGFLVMARHLTPARLQRLEEGAQLHLSLLSVDQISGLTLAVPTQIQVVEDGRIRGDVLLTDPGGHPVVALRVLEQRRFFQQGQVWRRVIMLTLALAGLVFMGVVWWLLERLFLSRLARMDRAIHGIRRLGSGEARVPVEGDNELDRLAVAINETLDALQETQEKWQHDALHDPLIGIANRTLFMQHLGAALDRARQAPGTCVAVLMIDIDHFKKINDSYGHLVGDEFLLTIARRISGVLRAVDLLARLGGDEFAVLLEAVGDAGEALACAERIREALSRPIPWQHHTFHVSASLGVAIHCGGTAAAVQLLREADTAMYRGKQRGRNCCVLFDAVMHDEVVYRLEVENELRQGMERGELRAYFQPCFDLHSGRIRGFEALVRWAHPTRGLLTPDKFIAVAEGAGLIHAIDRWMLGEASRCLVQWLGEMNSPRALSMSVNLSCTELNPRHLGPLVRNVLRHKSLPGANIFLEVTESALCLPEEEFVRQLHELKDLGVRLSLDDFGTGHSSLSRLHRMPFDELKIDRSFIANLNQGNVAITQTIILLAHSLGMKVVAEGIETEEQLAILRELGCDGAQGYLFSKPLDEAAAARFLRDNLQAGEVQRLAEHGSPPQK
jgi:diguanylate cyclase (GGDEF)-like protein